MMMVQHGEYYCIITRRRFVDSTMLVFGFSIDKDSDYIRVWVRQFDADRAWFYLYVIVICRQYDEGLRSMIYMHSFSTYCKIFDQ